MELATKQSEAASLIPITSVHTNAQTLGKESHERCLPRSLAFEQKIKLFVPCLLQDFPMEFWHLVAKRLANDGHHTSKP